MSSIIISIRNDSIIKCLFFDQTDYGLGYISILFKVVQNEDFDEGPQFAMVMSDRNVFPKPFEKLPFDSCAKYGYTEYEVLVRCCEVGEFIYMLQAAPGFLG